MHIITPLVQDTVTDIIDGDTYHTKETGTIRLIGIDTPEVRKNSPLYELNNTVKQELTDLVLNKPVSLDICATRTVDDYNRIRAIVYLDNNNKRININTYLLKRGYAKIMNVRPCHIDAGKLWQDIEKKAKQKKLGIWADGIALLRDPIVIINPAMLREDKGLEFWIDEKLYISKINQRMSKEDMILYTYYCFRCNYEGLVWTTYDTIKNETGLWRASIPKSNSSLKELGLIDMISGRRFQRSNIIQVLRIPD